MSARTVAKEPLAWLGLVLGVAGGGAAGTALDQPNVSPTVAVSTERYERDRGEDTRRMERLEDKLDRVLEQLVARKDE